MCVNHRLQINMGYVSSQKWSQNICIVPWWLAPAYWRSEPCLFKCSCFWWVWLFDALWMGWNVTIDSWDWLVISPVILLAIYTSAPRHNHNCTNSNDVTTTRWQHHYCSKLFFDELRDTRKQTESIQFSHVSSDGITSYLLLFKKSQCKHKPDWNSNKTMCRKSAVWQTS